MTGDRLLIVFASLRAEGTQRLALDLCSAWKEMGIAASVVSLSGGEPEMVQVFEGQDVPLDAVGRTRGHSRGCESGLAYADLWPFGMRGLADVRQILQARGPLSVGGS